MIEKVRSILVGLKGRKNSLYFITLYDVNIYKRMDKEYGFVFKNLRCI